MHMYSVHGVYSNSDQNGPTTTAISHLEQKAHKVIVHEILVAQMDLKIKKLEIQKLEELIEFHTNIPDHDICRVHSAIGADVHKTNQYSFTYEQLVCGMVGYKADLVKVLSALRKMLYDKDANGNPNNISSDLEKLKDLWEDKRPRFD